MRRSPALHWSPGARVAHGGERRAVIAALLANLGIAVSKFVGFAVTGSASLLAEALGVDAAVLLRS